MIVMKFGGSSLRSAEALAKVADIIAAHAPPAGRGPVVVVSAMGKTTDRLLGIAETAVAGNGEEAARLLDGLRAYLATEAGPVVPEGSRPVLAAFLDREFGELTELVGGLAALGDVPPPLDRHGCLVRRTHVQCGDDPRAAAERFGCCARRRPRGHRHRRSFYGGLADS